MDYLDKPAVPDPASVSNRNLAIKYGAIWAGVGFLMTVIGYLTNTDPGLPSTSALVKGIYTILGFGVAIWAITTAIRTDRDQQLGGFIGLGRCVGLGALIGLVCGVIGGILQLLYMTVINPTYSETMQAAIQQQFADQGMSEEQIEQATAMTSMFTGTIPTFITFIFVGLLSGLLISLIAGVFMKREAAPMR
jgi:hypothetical protein